MSRIITPNAARKLRKLIAEEHAKLVQGRARYLEAKAHTANILDLEDLLADVLEARLWYWTYRRRLESAEVVVGSAWSPRGLERVRAANKRR